MDSEVSLNDVYIAARTHRNFDYIYWLDSLLTILSKSAIRNLSIILVVFASFLITLIAYWAFFVLLPIVAVPWSIWFNFNIVWGVFLLYAISFNYYMGVNTSPGTTADIHIHDENNMDDRLECKKCNKPKPPRTHHCSICKRCVLKMDHHCPWLNNCVGLRNYRYFICFLLWLSIATFYILCILAPLVFKPGSIFWYDFTTNNNSGNLRGSLRLDSVPVDSIVTTIENKHKDMKQDGSKVDYSGLSFLYQYFLPSQYMSLVIKDTNISNDMVMLITFLVCFGAFLGVSLLLAVHTYLLLTGQTTLEYYRSMYMREKLKKERKAYSNPYDLGYYENFKSVFGNVNPLIAILPAVREPPGSAGSDNTITPTTHNNRLHSPSRIGNRNSHVYEI